MPEKDVELLALVSEPLLFELHFEMYANVFESHFFFARYKTECPSVMRKICHFATDMQLFSRGDVVFSVGEILKEPKAHIFHEGKMRYVNMNGEVEEICTEQWITEQTLWTKWMHRGVLTALDDCRLYSLEASKFIDIVTQFEHMGFNPRAYAHAYVSDLNAMGDAFSDLAFHGESRGSRAWDIKQGTHVYNVMTQEYNICAEHGVNKRRGAGRVSLWARKFSGQSGHH